MSADAGQRVELAHDGLGVAQVADGLEQRHDDQVVARAVVQRAAQQPALPSAAAAPRAGR
jgi:hypothetical protein